MLDKILLLMKGNSSFNEEYTKALSSLWRIHIIEFLRELAKPKIISLGADVQVMATQAARSAGYNECLDDLTQFLEKFIEPASRTTKIIPDFGGITLALNKGDLDEDEANELKDKSSQ